MAGIPDEAVRHILTHGREGSLGRDNVRFDFETWLVQNYGLKKAALTEDELRIAEREYEEEYPPEGEHPIGVKTYPFKKYIDSRK
jgi:hypothetical protein